MWEGEWLLEYPGVAYSIGGVNPDDPFKRPRNVYHREAPAIGDVGVTTDDEPRPRTDGVTFGTDSRQARTIRLEVGMQGDGNTAAEAEADALQLAGQLEAAWRADSVRRAPGALATLSTRNAGRERMAYGRPRRFVRLDTRRKSAGKITATCEFDTVDDVFYSRTQTGVVVPYVPPSSGGVVAPLTDPVTATQPFSNTGALFVAGDLPAHPVAVIAGPITNPAVELVNEWRLALNVTIPAGVAVTLDGRPWRRTVTRSDGGSIAGRLTPSSRLDRATLTPGAHIVRLTGTDSTGLSSLTFSWQSTYASI